MFNLIKEKTETLFNYVKVLVTLVLVKSDFLGFQKHLWVSTNFYKHYMSCSFQRKNLTVPNML